MLDVPTYYAQLERLYQDQKRRGLLPPGEAERRWIQDRFVSADFAKREARRMVAVARRQMRYPGSGWRDAAFRKLSRAARITRGLLRANACGDEI